MKSDTSMLGIIAASWIIICFVITVIITGAVITSGTFVVYCSLLFSPVLFNPLSRLMLLGRKSPFVLVKKRHRAWLHLNPWLSVGHAGLRGISDFWDALVRTLNAGLATSEHAIILSSHLLSARRMARLLRYFPKEHYRYRVLRRPLSLTERTGLQLETLLKEWRLYSPSVRGGVLVIRKKIRGTDKYAVLEIDESH
ncbi:MAG: hypothetical protein P4L95_05855 [Rouxiella aceris]|uniref:hypothetical protein n=1 Tax=Rouxiella aceris TaxID=2703884 RepID=UPI00284C5B1C|nr:hypothetical protein [Rouxiella aceris]MDR3431422.1 hypothetical protein [Rouxiella aceris]